MASDGRVFFANTQADTDFFVTPQPSGAELWWQLRSPASPERLVLNVDLPEGAVLRRARSKNPIPGDPPRAIEIARGDKALGYIYPPVAYDADHQPVASAAAIEGDRVVVTVEHRGKDLRYPLAVDPEVVQPNAYGSIGWIGWNWAQDPAQATGANINRFGQARNDPAYARGLYTSMPTNNYFDPGKLAQFSYRAPGNTYIYRAALGDQWHTPLSANGYTYSLWYSGIMNAAFSAWQQPVNSVNQFGGVGSNPNGPTSQAYAGINHDFCFIPRCDRGQGEENNMVVFGIKAQNPYNGQRFYTYTYKGAVAIGYANIYLGDRRPPILVTPPTDKTWADDTDSPDHTRGVTGRDQGMGMSSLTMTGAAAGPQTKTSSCGGDIYRSPCIADYGANFTYRLNEGTNALTLKAKDIVDNTSPTHTWTEKIDRSPPSLSSPSGSLWDARNRSDDRRHQGVYASTATLKATATDSGSGVADMEVYVDGVSQRSRGGYTTGATLDWNWDLATNGIADGTYTVTIVARDNITGQAGAPAARHQTTSQPFTITIDRSGDVYAGQFSDGDPQAGEEVYAREWARAGSSTARREIPGHSVATRGPAPCADGQTDRACESVRTRTRIGPSSTNDTDDFVILKGDADDSDLRNVSQLLAPGREQRTVVETGDLVSIARPWQILPPAHGAQFQRFDFTEQRDETEPVEPDGGQSGTTRTVRQRLYVDSATRMPVRQLELGADGQVADETFWTYDVDRKEASGYPADFFAVAEPATPNERVEVQQQRTRTISSPQDRETNASFTPAFFGPSMDLPGLGTFCLARNDMNVVTPNPVGGEQVPVGEEDPEIPDAVAYARDTFVTAAYHLKVGDICRPGLRAGDVAFTVTTLARDSTNARSWREVFEQDGSALPLDPQSPWLLQEGLLPLVLNLQATIAYLVPGVADNTSALMDVGDATILLTGPFNSTTLAVVANQLRSQ